MPLVSHFQHFFFIKNKTLTNKTSFPLRPLIALYDRYLTRYEQKIDFRCKNVWLWGVNIKRCSSQLEEFCLLDASCEPSSVLFFVKTKTLANKINFRLRSLRVLYNRYLRRYEQKIDFRCKNVWFLKYGEYNF